MFSGVALTVTCKHSFFLAGIGWQPASMLQSLSSGTSASRGRRSLAESLGTTAIWTSSGKALTATCGMTSVWWWLAFRSRRFESYGGANMASSPMPMSWSGHLDVFWRTRVTFNPVEPCFSLGAGSIVTTGHKIDFTDRVEIGRRTIIGGRNSSIWTHNRQRTLPIRIGEFTYVGSEIRMAPGGSLPSRCIVGIGSVITKRIEADGWLIAGVPAKPIRELGAEDKFLIERKTRPDLPDDI